MWITSDFICKEKLQKGMKQCNFTDIHPPNPHQKLFKQPCLIDKCINVYRRVKRLNSLTMNRNNF